MAPRCRAVILLLAVLAAAHATRIPTDPNQWAYSPRDFKANKQSPVQRFWDRSLLDQAYIVENYAQLKPLLDKLNAGQPVTVVSVGDSTTAAYGGCFHRDMEQRKRHVTLIDPQTRGVCTSGASMQFRWLTSFMEQINSTWPHPEHVLINLAKPGGVFQSWSEGECLEEYFPRQADLFIVEHLPSLEPVNRTVLQAERLLHRLWLHMQAPLPAIIFVNMYPILPQDGRVPSKSPERCMRDITLCPTECPTYFQRQPDPRTLYIESELHTHAVASYYGLTSLSHPALVHALMRDRWPQRMQGLKECEALSMLYADSVHPDIHGRLLLSDLLVNLLDVAQTHIDAMAAAKTPRSLWARSLPAQPIEPESVTLYRSRCLYSAAKVHEDMGTANLHTMRMLKTEGWQFVEYDGEAKKYKPGWVATTPGSTLWIDVPLALAAETSGAQGRRTILDDGTSTGLSDRRRAPAENFRWHLGRVTRKLGEHADVPARAPDPAWVRQIWSAELDGAEFRSFEAAAAVPVSNSDPRRTRSTLSSGTEIHFTMHLILLRSYQHMGKAKLTCLESCRCSQQYDGYYPNVRNSIPHIERVEIYAPNAAGRCVLEVKVLPETNSGEHKVKVIQMALGTHLNMTEQLMAVAMATHHSSKNN